MGQAPKMPDKHIINVQTLLTKLLASLFKGQI